MTLNRVDPLCDNHVDTHPRLMSGPTLPFSQPRAPPYRPRSAVAARPQYSATRDESSVRNGGDDDLGYSEMADEPAGHFAARADARDATVGLSGTVDHSRNRHEILKRMGNSHVLDVGIKHHLFQGQELDNSEARHLAVTRYMAGEGKVDLNRSHSLYRPTASVHRNRFSKSVPGVPGGGTFDGTGKAHKGDTAEAAISGSYVGADHPAPFLQSGEWAPRHYAPQLNRGLAGGPGGGRTKYYADSAWRWRTPQNRWVDTTGRKPGNWCDPCTDDGSDPYLTKVPCEFCGVVIFRHSLATHLAACNRRPRIAAGLTIRSGRFCHECGRRFISTTQSSCPHCGTSRPT